MILRGENPLDLFGGNLKNVQVLFYREVDLAIKIIFVFKSFNVAETLALLPPAVSCAILRDGKNVYLITWLSRQVAAAMAKC